MKNKSVRNEPCPCGSGKKYKFCHLADDRAAHREGFFVRDAQRREAEKAAKTARHAKFMARLGHIFNVKRWQTPA